VRATKPTKTRAFPPPVPLGIFIFNVITFLAEETALALM